jgi:hypothetical protein
MYIEVANNAKYMAGIDNVTRIHFYSCVTSLPYFYLHGTDSVTVTTGNALQNNTDVTRLTM